MPTVLDPLAVRVARRYLAVLRNVEPAADRAVARVAIEYQRRPHGLERVEPDEQNRERGEREGYDDLAEVEDLGQGR